MPPKRGHAVKIFLAPRVDGPANEFCADVLEHPHVVCFIGIWPVVVTPFAGQKFGLGRSEEHTSELQSLMRISYAVFCLKKKKKNVRKSKMNTEQNTQHT